MFQVFCYEMESAWTGVMNIQILVTLPSKPLRNPFEELLRKKHDFYSPLLAHCQCEQIKPSCPPNPPGSPEEPGLDGCS